MRRLQNGKLKAAVEYLESIGLEIMGSPAIDLETGKPFAQCRNYDAEEVIQYRTLWEDVDNWRALKL